MTYGKVQHRKSTIHGPPITLRILRVKSDKSDFLSHCLTERNILVPKGRSPFGHHQESRPLGATIMKYKGINRILLTRFLRSLHLLRMPEMVAPRVSRFPTAGQGERRLWERD